MGGGRRWWLGVALGALGGAAVGIRLRALGQGQDGLAAVRARGYVRVGVPLWWPPFGAPSREGRWAGLDVAVARALAAALLHSPQAVRLLPLVAGERLWAVRERVVDAVAAAFAGPPPGRTPVPPAGVELVGPYYHDRLALLVLRRAPLRRRAELDGSRVGVLGTGPGEAALARASAPAHPVAVRLESPAAALAELAAGRLRALVGGGASLMALSLYDPETRIQPWPAMGSETYWLLLPAGEAALAAAAKSALQRLPSGSALQLQLRRWALEAASFWPPPEQRVPPAPAGVEARRGDALWTTAVGNEDAFDVFAERGV